ncbi:MAG TPA: carbonic anhydrase [Anaerolineales bacterium]|nr:carbonic anhydrase [Anaerolineales bacterium]
MTDHSCEALVVHCMDHRLQKYLNDWLDKDPGGGNYDRVAIAGGVLDIYPVLKQIELAIQLHKISKVILVNHEDCGAYGPGGTRPRQAADLAEAERRVHALHPDLIVEKYYLKLDGVFEQVY